MIGLSWSYTCFQNGGHFTTFTNYYWSILGGRDINWNSFDSLSRLLVWTVSIDILHLLPSNSSSLSITTSITDSKQCTIWNYATISSPLSGLFTHSSLPYSVIKYHIWSLWDAINVLHFLASFWSTHYAQTSNSKYTQS